MEEQSEEVYLGNETIANETYIPTFEELLGLCNDTVTDNKNTNIEMQTYAMIAPALLSMLFFSILQKRLSTKTICGFDRPGIAFPIRLLEQQRNRISYVAAFCITGYQVLDLLRGKFPFGWYADIDESARGVVKLLACFMFGLLHWPIFAALSSAHWLGYLIGSLYTWSMTALNFTFTQPCWNGNPKSIIIEFFTMVPPLAFYIYLSLILPYRAVMAYRKPEKQPKITNDYSELYEVQYVCSMLRQHADQKQAKQNATGMKGRVTRARYYNIVGFRYSLSILCGVSLAIVTAYILALETLKSAFWVFAKQKYFIQQAKYGENKAHWVEQIFHIDISEIITVEMLDHAYFWVGILEGCTYFAFVVAFCVMVASMLSTLRHYRSQLLGMYRGIYKEIGRDDSKTPRSILISGCKYVGYQVGYAVWGFYIMLVVVALITFIIVGFFALVIRYEFTDLLIEVVKKIGPLLALMLVMNMAQHAVAHFCFLQTDEHNQRVLAINNRRAFFNFHYFLVFLNAALGLISCLVRIAKAVIFGIWILPRLDLSTMSRQFEQMDPGYISYTNLLRLENTQTNPLMIVFVNLMLEILSDKHGQNFQANSYTNGGCELSKPVAFTKKYRRRYVLKWHVAVMLQKNIYLQYLRKKHLDNIKKIEVCESTSTISSLIIDKESSSVKV